MPTVRVSLQRNRRHHCPACAWLQLGGAILLGRHRGCPPARPSAAATSAATGLCSAGAADVRHIRGRRCGGLPRAAGGFADRHFWLGKRSSSPTSHPAPSAPTTPPSPPTWSTTAPSRRRPQRRPRPPPPSPATRARRRPPPRASPSAQRCPSMTRCCRYLALPRRRLKGTTMPYTSHSGHCRGAVGNFKGR